MNDSARDRHFDAVIIGSGFGGSVTAYRLAEAGLRVCVLERGKPYPPNSFPRAPHRMKMNFWDPSEGLYGMYNIWSFSGLGAVVCSGLGGGSLIYANVMIRKDEKWFVKEDLEGGGFEYWPVTRADLDPHYDRVEKMLGAQYYPVDHKPYNETRKTQEFRAAAKRLGLDWKPLKLAVTFANKGEDPVPGEPIYDRPNLHGRTRETCRLVGECDIGCNFGSKNTLDYSYLSEAKLRYGAEIRTLCEVQRFEHRSGEGYAVYYRQHDPDPEREGQKTDTDRLPEHRITTDRLVLAAGTLGTTFLMLKNSKAFPGLSSRLGTRFCGNGDLITFASRSRKRDENGEWVPRLIDAGYGPVITSAVRVADREDGGDGRGFYVEDAGYSEFVNWMLQVFDTPGALLPWWHGAGWGLISRWLGQGLLGRGLLWRSAGKRLRNKWLSGQPETDMGAEISGLFGENQTSAGLLPMLGMGRDIPNGKMKLRGGKLDVDWRLEDSDSFFRGVRETMKSIADELGARFSDPLGHINRVVTVHPLGGCPMGRNKTEGVVNPYGAVFGCPPGLYVADGSVMPGPVGPNPSLTIAALADRFAGPIIERKGPEE
jgi:cholesterol oxidase